MSVPAALRARAKELKRHTLTVYFVARDPRTPLLVRGLAVLIAAYALSPIDLIPDFIPVLGYLDEIVLIPLGLALVVRLTPPAILATARDRALEVSEKPVSYVGAAFVVALWLAAAGLLVGWLAGIG